MTSLGPENFPHRYRPRQRRQTSQPRQNGQGGPQATLTGEMLSDICDDNCHVARHGGEEFVMLFRGTTLSEAKERLDDIREKLAHRRLVNRKTDQPFEQITFSAGVADVFDFSDPRAALKAADEALYAAKQGGRNQVRLADKA